MTGEFVRNLSGKKGRKIEIRVFIPQKSELPNGDWECAYIISGFGDQKKRVATGIDAIQALVLALIHVSTALYSSEEFDRGEITWEGGLTKFDLGLPMAEVIRKVVEEKKQGRAH